jgi:hypothetical protein
VKVYPFLRRLSSFTGRLLVFTFLLSLLLAFLWLAGNLQGFLDATQASIQTILRWTLLVEIATAAWTTGVLAARSWIERRLFPVRFTLAVVCLAAGVFLLGSLRFVLAWLRP